MKTVTRPFDIIRKPLQKSGRYCSVGHCMEQAIVLERWSELKFIGRGVRRQKYACRLHAEIDQSKEEA